MYEITGLPDDPDMARPAVDPHPAQPDTSWKRKAHFSVPSPTAAAPRFRCAFCHTNVSSQSQMVTGLTDDIYICVHCVTNASSLFALHGVGP